MPTPERVGSVAELWRFPVKSMRGERLDTVDLTDTGIAGDRAYGIVDVASGKVASAKHPRLWPDLLRCRATFDGPPVAGRAAPPARIELGDGTVVRSDAPDVDDVLSRYLGRQVTLTRAAPADYTIAEYHPDVEHLNPAGDRDVVVDQRLGSAFFAALGLPSVVPEGALVDLFPLSVLTTSSLRRFAGLTPDSDWDVRRFRMNVIIDSTADGLAENEWVGSALTFGGGASLVAAIPTPRCVMTGLALEELPRDPAMLKSIARHNRLDVAGAGLYPCLGVYAVPARPGAIHVGDPVTTQPAEFALTVPDVRPTSSPTA
jgi:uncharacterized protein YcbX